MILKLICEYNDPFDMITWWHKILKKYHESSKWHDPLLFSSLKLYIFNLKYFYLSKKLPDDGYNLFHVHFCVSYMCV